MANANVFSQFMRPAKSMAEYGAEYDRADENKLQLAAKRMQMQQAERSMADQQTARTAYSTSGGDAAKYRNALVNAGLFQEVQALDAAGLKSRETEADITLKGANAKKAGVDADKDQLAMVAQRIDLAGKAFGFVRDNPSAENAQRVVQSLMQGGVWNQQQAEQAMSEIQANPTPEGIKALATKAFQATLAAKDQLPQLFNQSRGGTFAVQSINPVTMQAADVSSAPITQSADNAASQETARLKREQDARDAAAGRAVQYAGQRIQRDRLEFDKVDSVRKLSEKPLNDTQSKALLFGSRMREADKVLESLAKAGTKASVPGSRAGYGIGSVVTALSSSQQQQLDQAKRDFLSAVLRRESGAVISDSEFDNGDKQYFPQIGDGKDVIAQKARNRKLATDGILQEVPENRRDGLQPTPQMPTADDVRKQADAILKGG